MSDLNIDALARHAAYGHLEGQDYDAVLELVSEVRVLRAAIAEHRDTVLGLSQDEWEGEPQAEASERLWSHLDGGDA